MAIGLAYCDSASRIYFDRHRSPLADGGIIRAPAMDELIPAPPGTVSMILPGRRPLLAQNGEALQKILRGRPTSEKFALAVILPAGFTRLLVPAYSQDENAPALPLFGYTFACVVNDELYVAAMRTDESDDWQPRYFAEGELEGILERRLEIDPENRVLRQVALCSCEYGCFTAQNVFLERGEAALPVSPRCNARCIGCISAQEPYASRSGKSASTVPAPQTRISFDTLSEDLARVAIHHLERVVDGIVSFGQGCEGEPLLRGITITRAIELIRASRSNGTINLNTNGSMTGELQRCIDAGLQAVRISLNSFRPGVYAAYYRPLGYTLENVFESIRLASDRGLRVSLNVLTHPGVTDDEEEIAAMTELLRGMRVDMIQTRTLNIDPEWYFAAVGRPKSPLGMRHAIEAIRDAHVSVGNFTHTH